MKPLTRKQNTFYLALALLLITAIGSFTLLQDSSNTPSSTTTIIPAISATENLSRPIIDSSNEGLQINSSPVQSLKTDANTTAASHTQTIPATSITPASIQSKTSAPTALNNQTVNKTSFAKPSRGSASAGTGSSDAMEKEANQITDTDAALESIADGVLGNPSATPLIVPDADPATPSSNPANAPIIIAGINPTDRFGSAPKTSTQSPTVNTPETTSSVPAVDAPFDNTEPLNTPASTTPIAPITSQKIVSIPEPSVAMLFAVGLFLLVISMLHRRRLSH